MVSYSAGYSHACSADPSHGQGPRSPLHFKRQQLCAAAAPETRDGLPPATADLSPTSAPISGVCVGGLMDENMQRVWGIRIQQVPGDPSVA